MLRLSKRCEICTLQKRMMLSFIPQTVSNYDRFVSFLFSSAKSLFLKVSGKNTYAGMGTVAGCMKNSAKELLHSLDEARKERWAQTTSKIDLQHPIWGLLRKLTWRCQPRSSFHDTNQLEPCCWNCQPVQGLSRKNLHRQSRKGV